MPTPNAALAIDRIANIALDFTAAQDNANRVYDEVLRKTGRGSDASNAYKQAMSEYFNHIEIKPRRRKVLRVADTATEQSVTYYNDWATFVRKVEQTDTLPMMGDRD